jgi:hypothetical protein
MDDPRANPVPEQYHQKVTALARDLAYGAYHGLWSPEFAVWAGLGGDPPSWLNFGDYTQEFSALFDSKWTPEHTPDSTMLEIMGYTRFLRMNRDNNPTYVLTDKALDLLNKPTTAPTVFIGYGRQQSSAFALLIEARLRERGVHAFIDKMLEGGEEWEARIKDTLQKRVSHFLCVIGPQTLLRPNVQNEIHWALEAGRVCIPIWHAGFSGQADQLPDDATVRAFVDRKNAIRVLEESALAYDSAMNQLLNQLEFGAMQQAEALTAR